MLFSTPLLLLFCPYLKSAEYKCVSVLLGHSCNLLNGILGLLAAVGVEEILAFLGNVESLLVACGIAVVTVGYLLNNSRELGIVLYAANNLFHNIFLSFYFYVTHRICKDQFSSLIFTIS